MRRAQAHQLLHGYRSGHGQIAASLKLADRDSDLITRLSDLSGSLSSGLQCDPYLTVYRLPSRSFFAVARTWPDPDATRAGCVLTHTILIPIDYWETIPSVRSIDLYFHDPRVAGQYDFAAPLDLSLDRTTKRPTTIQVDAFSSQLFVSRYFGQGIRPIVWFNAEEPEEYLWRLLQHLWPKLRSSFSSCTFSLQQRTLEDGPFDLLFAPSSLYSRFGKLSAEHLIESAMDRTAPKASFEPWCEYWAKALFSYQPGLPSKESELPIWGELGEDPTVIRKLSLVHELRLRAKQSPTAGVGAIDVVESLARDPEAAVLLKRQVLTDAIEAASAAEPAEDALTSLRLIGDRLGRESFRDIAEDFEGRLSSAAATITVKAPEAALKVSGEWLANSVVGVRGAFGLGVMKGLRELANDNPSRLTSIRSFPAVAAELFRLVPAFGGTYLEVGGDAAREVLADWLSSTRDMETLRLVRKSLLSSLRQPDDEALLSPLLRDLRSDDVAETLSVLSKLGSGFSNRVVRSIVADRISSAYPELVRHWAADNSNWSTDVSEIVAATYPPTRNGFIELLEEDTFGRTQHAQVVAIMLRNQLSVSSPYWLRELISQDTRLIRVLLLAGAETPDTVEAVLPRLLTEVPDLPIAKAGDLLDTVLNFQGRPVFPQLLDSTMRSVITYYVTEGAEEARRFLNHSSTFPWFQSVSGSQLTSILGRDCARGPGAVARAWKWLSEAPRTLYERRPSLLPELCDALLVCVRRSFPDGVEACFSQLLKRAASESDTEVRRALSGRMLRYAFDNVRYPLGAVVAEGFADAYSVAVESSHPPSFFFGLFSLYDWDKGKELRISLVDAFLRSAWAPGDLAIAANNAGILRKIFKRLHRKPKGDDYIRAMHRDLAGRNDPVSARLAENLKLLMADWDFYEEWD